MSSLSLQSFLAAANDLQIKGLTTPTVNSFRQNRNLEEDNTAGTLAKKIKKERSSEQDTNKVNRSLLKRRNTESSGQEEIKQEDEKDTQTQMKEEEDNLEENLDSQHEAEENSYEELSQDQDGANFRLEDGHFSGSQADDVAAG